MSPFIGHHLALCTLRFKPLVLSHCTLMTYFCIKVGTRQTHCSIYSRFWILATVCKTLLWEPSFKSPSLEILKICWCCWWLNQNSIGFLKCKRLKSAKLACLLVSMVYNMSKNVFQYLQSFGWLLGCASWANVCFDWHLTVCMGCHQNWFSEKLGLLAQQGEGGLTEAQVFVEIFLNHICLGNG